MMYWNGLGYALMMIGNLVFWGLALFVVISFFRAADRRERGQTASRDERGDPERILAERFARGEMDAEEYRMRHHVLSEHRSGGVNS